jgi:hypothetical protein
VPPKRVNPALILFLAVAFGSFVFLRMAAAFAPWDGVRYGVGHHYEYLAEGFVSGHTYLSVDPPSDQLALKDPYKPGQSVSGTLLDASLYQGHYYLYYGPAPAVVLMVPWRLLTGRMVPQRVAVGLAGVAALAALALLLRSVQRRLYPDSSGLLLAGAFAFAAHASWLPVVIRRPLFWELPIISAVACLWWALYFLWRFRDSGGGRRWALAMGIALGLLIGCRVTYVFAAAAILLLMLGDFGDSRRPWSSAALASGIVTLAGLALLLYNHVRFGRWLEFGQSYQLWGDDYRNLRFFDPRYLLFNARTYLVSIDSPSPFFPFVRPLLPLDGPVGYMGVDEVYGALASIPVQGVGLVCLAAAMKRRGAFTAFNTLAAAGAATTGLLALILFLWGGAGSRYVAELWSGWTVLAGLGLIHLFATPGRLRRWLRPLAVAAGLWTVAFVWLASMDNDGIMRLTRPVVYGAWARVMDYPSLWWTKLRGIEFGPLELTVRLSPLERTGGVALLSSGRRDRSNELVLVRTDSTHARLELVEEGSRVVASSRPIEAKEGIIRVRVEAPWLYPPPQHPYWDRFPDAALRHRLQIRFALDVAGQPPVEAEATSSEAEELRPGVLGRGDPGSAVGWVESWRRTGSPGGGADR